MAFLRFNLFNGGAFTFTIWLNAVIGRAVIFRRRRDRSSLYNTTSRIVITIANLSAFFCWL
jgi:uncharacterized membrane protein